MRTFESRRSGGVVSCRWTLLVPGQSVDVVGGHCQLSVDIVNFRWTLSIVSGHCQLSVDIEFDLSQLSPGQPVTHVSSGRKDQNRDCKYRAKLK